ncbi:hypothetical protein GBAR_LOCUS4889 [Geodia barretti]|uniref:Uncharacterized protein n=1 Tax=Geodia barretti TaxID=519541 RepID=A0AA35W7D4_GEOBA|nr:hypothetical protein GBAR_LOCUS4889 [Geodia barretti]
MQDSKSSSSAEYRSKPIEATDARNRSPDPTDRRWQLVTGSLVNLTQQEHSSPRKRPGCASLSPRFRRRRQEHGGDRQSGAFDLMVRPVYDKAPEDVKLEDTDMFDNPAGFSTPHAATSAAHWGSLMSGATPRSKREQINEADSAQSRGSISSSISLVQPPPQSTAREICSIGGSVSLSQLRSRRQTSVPLGTMTINQGKIELKVTVKCLSSSPDVMLKLTPKIPRRCRNRELLTMPLKAMITVSETSSEPEDEFQPRKTTRDFTLEDHSLQWTLFCEADWAKPNNGVEKIYVSIRVTHEHLTMRHDADSGFVTIDPPP